MSFKKKKSPKGRNSENEEQNGRSKAISNFAQQTGWINLQAMFPRIRFFPHPILNHSIQ